MTGGTEQGTVNKTVQRELDRHAVLREEREQATGIGEDAEFPVNVEPISQVSVRKFRDREHVDHVIALVETQLSKRAEFLRKRGFLLETDFSEPIHAPEPASEKRKRRVAERAEPRREDRGQDRAARGRDLGRGGQARVREGCRRAPRADHAPAQATSDERSARGLSSAATSVAWGARPRVRALRMKPGDRPGHEGNLIHSARCTDP